MLNEVIHNLILSMNVLVQNLQHFRRLFYARVPVNCLNFIDIIPELRNTHLQSAFIQATFISAINLKYPPRVDYQRKVLKTLIDQVFVLALFR